jgi:hypothetical protein
MQQPIIDLYLAEKYSVHRVESSISGWYLYPSLMGILMGLNSLPKRPSNFGMMFWIYVVAERANPNPYSLSHKVIFQ